MIRFCLQWLETHWVAPAYAGAVLLGLAVSFFGAAINSMAGWLYAISGVMFAIALINIWSSPRSLNGLQVYRSAIRPVSVGEALTVELLLENTTPRSKVLLQAKDPLPSKLGDTPTTAIATLAARQHHAWRYTCSPKQRGIYHWDAITLRTAAPFGLFWCQRPLKAPANAIVYPQILPLSRCPLIDQMGTSEGMRWQAARQSQTATEGLTRAVRPYRWGDPTRLIHWRTSARYGELRVRELEQMTADNEVLIGLDTSDRWSAVAFESAVVAAASLYVYGLQHQLAIALWLPHTGILQTQPTVLSALAAVMPGSTEAQHRLPNQAMIWLGPSAAPPSALPSGSAWVRWLDTAIAPAETWLSPTLSISPHQSLSDQLQSDITVGTKLA